MCTDFRIDSFQQSYFVIDSFDAIIRALDADIPALLLKLRGRRVFDPATVQDSDRLIAR